VLLTSVACIGTIEALLQLAMKTNTPPSKLANDLLFRKFFESHRSDGALIEPSSGQRTLLLNHFTQRTHAYNMMNEFLEWKQLEKTALNVVSTLCLSSKSSVMKNLNMAPQAAIIMVEN